MNTRSNNFCCCINVDDESSFLHPPGGDCRNNVRFPSFEKSDDCTFKCASSVTHLTVMKTFHTFRTILTSAIRSEDRQE